MTDISRKTLTIVKRGRKYLECTLGRAKAQLVISDLTAHLEAGAVVEIPVRDLSERSKYGANLRFEAVSEEAAQQVLALVEAEKWLGFAERDVQNGSYKSNAVIQARTRCPAFPQLTDRLAAVAAKAQKNADEYESQAAERQRVYQEEKMAREEKQASRRANRVLVPLAVRPAKGIPTRLAGRILVIEDFGKSFRIDESAPSCNGSHLLGYEGEMGCYAYYRLATDDEIAKLEDEEEKDHAHRRVAMDHQAAVKHIADEIQRSGELPEGVHQPEGSRFLDTQDIYGHGFWFVIGEAWIWYIQNNGSDGDDWSRNNVSTGGAGAIGWRLPYSEAVAGEIMALASSVNS